MIPNTAERPVRLNRSQLAVPGSNPRFLEKARISDADIVMLDIEDSVAPADKAKARQNIADMLLAEDWSAKTVSVRINAADTQFMYRDLVDVMEKAGEHVDLVMVPKVENAATVFMIDTLLQQIESAMGITSTTGLELQIESAKGLQNIEEIAAASRRTESLHFGPGDYAASIHARVTDIGGQSADYEGDMWHYVLSRIVVAARANGLRPVDGPYSDFNNPEAFRMAAKRTATLGFEGKWVIHPSQIEMANEIMGPDSNQIDDALNILKAMKEAEASGKGAVTLNGRMVDYASVRQAEMLVEKARLAGLA
jgi:malyl-CoA/(S)-citramalyl-CoA lyase